MVGSIGNKRANRSMNDLSRISRPWIYYFILIVPLQLILFYPLTLFAAGFSSPGNKTLEGFETVHSETAPGLKFSVFGESLLTGEKLKNASRVQVSISSPIEKAFLIWSGEVKDGDQKFDEITLLTPSDKEFSIKARTTWQKNSTGVLYSAIADVTKYVGQSGLYGVKNLRSDLVNPGGKDPYSVAGWALVVLSKDPGLSESRKVVIVSGLQILKPGETYDLFLTGEEGSMKAHSIGIVGGHGLAGNGSGNLLNNRGISGGDDWDGSAGKLWDVDFFKIKDDNSSVGEKSFTLTIDPLLQWLYPVAVILNLSPAK